MNKERRKAIAVIISDLQEIGSKLEDLKERIEGVRDEEQEYFDVMPESLQSGDKGSLAEDAIGYLDEAYSAFDDFDVDEIVGNLEAAAE